MDKIFEMRKIKGVRFLFIPSNGNTAVQVIAENGDNYGSFFSRTSFLQFWKKGILPLSGKVNLNIQLREKPIFTS